MEAADAKQLAEGADEARKRPRAVVLPSVARWH